MGFLEFSLNTLGDPETSTREKEIIINESYSKAFLSDKVQIEDDWMKPWNHNLKDVQAYLQRCGFLLQKGGIQFRGPGIYNLFPTRGHDLFQGHCQPQPERRNVEGVQVSNNQARYIEINLDDDEQVLKIAVFIQRN